MRRFERGLCDPDVFAREIVAELDLPIEPSRFLERFATWPERLYPGAMALVSAVRRKVQVACLSNSNALHWAGPMREFGLHEAFDHTFVSHEMGTLKPDREAFDHVLQRLQAAPQHILFMDDNQINVDAARSSGIDAHRVRGIAEARALLRMRGLSV